MSTKSSDTHITTASSSSDNPAAEEASWLSKDYRGFVFVVHPNHGLLLLYCSRKEKKGPHYQLPGGHVDREDASDDLDNDDDNHSNNNNNNSNSNNNNNNRRDELLLLACKRGAARELMEETGLDVRNQLERLKPVVLRKKDNSKSNKKTSSSSSLVNELNHRLYFVLMVNDCDFFMDNVVGANSSDNDGDDDEPLQQQQGLTGPMNYNGDHLKLRLSHEHQGFLFEPNPIRSMELLKQHSGGNGSAALKMSMTLNCAPRK